MNIRLNDYEDGETGEVLWEGSFQEFVDENEFDQEEVSAMCKELDYGGNSVYAGGTGVQFLITKI